MIFHKIKLFAVVLFCAVMTMSVVTECKAKTSIQIYEDLLKNDQFTIAVEMAKTGNFGFYQFLESSGPRVLGLKCIDYKGMLLIDVDADNFMDEQVPYAHKMGEIHHNALEHNLTMYLYPNSPYKSKCALQTSHNARSGEEHIPERILKSVENIKSRMVKVFPSKAADQEYINTQNEQESTHVKNNPYNGELSFIYKGNKYNITGLPKFQDYPAEGKVSGNAVLDYSWAKKNIDAWYLENRKSFEQSANFNGHYAVITMGGACSGCQENWVADVVSGKLIGTFVTSFGTKNYISSGLIVADFPFEAESKLDEYGAELSHIIFYKIVNDKLVVVKNLDVFKAIEELNKKK
ncbi:MAG: hypothetical protein WC269_06350 [Candidatus Gracilibacteria bacterium]|jgi:hypothetical protein